MEQITQLKARAYDLIAQVDATFAVDWTSGWTNNGFMSTAFTYTVS